MCREMLKLAPGIDIQPQSRAEFTALVEAETARLADVVRRGNIKVDA